MTTCANCYGEYPTCCSNPAKMAPRRPAGRPGRGGSQEADDGDYDVADLDREPVKVVSSTDIDEDEVERLDIGINELDRILGGGVALGSVNLLTGEPGSGKSTLLAQALGAIAKAGSPVLYASGEESAGQVTSRFRRLGCAHDNLKVVANAGGLSLDDVEAAMEEVEPVAVVIDSIQTIFDPSVESRPGTPSQLTAVGQAIVGVCKENSVALFLVGHITKDGNVAGPKTVEHLVDAVFQFEGERGHSLRILRALKNRFGSTNETAIFEMKEDGMNEVGNVSEVLLAERSTAPGASVVCLCEGQTPLLAEVQALVTEVAGERAGKRVLTGVDPGRVQMILAVLKDRLPVGSLDIFVSLAGGLRTEDTALDLGIAVSILSAALQVPVGKDVALFGEISLAGGVRSVGKMDIRTAEALKMGFKKVVCAGRGRAGARGVVFVSTLDEALATVFGAGWGAKVAEAKGSAKPTGKNRAEDTVQEKRPAPRVANRKANDPPRRGKPRREGRTHR
jgi:DNA repair protein RadA/Sms